MNRVIKCTYWTDSVAGLALILCCEDFIQYFGLGRRNTIECVWLQYVGVAESHGVLVHSVSLILSLIILKIEDLF